MRKYMTALMMLLLPSAVLAQEAVIEAPERSSPGDLVILDGAKSDADDYRWLLANSDKVFLPVDDGKRCVFATGRPGTYVFILSVAKLVDGSAKVHHSQHVLIVGNPDPNPPGPNPDPDDPDDDEDDDDPDLSGTAKRIYEAAMTVNRKSQESQKLAKAYAETATTFKSLEAAGIEWELKDMAASLKTKVGEAFDDETKKRWTPVNEVSQKALSAAGTKEAAIQILQDIATGLNAVSNSKISSTTHPTLEVKEASPRKTLADQVDSINERLKLLDKAIGSP